ncbi:MAG: metallophosphoesterase family protein [Ignavibacteriae bacterium]|nr:metallophosphoesterase family protein [Ignavibacteriota bacterium]
MRIAVISDIHGNVFALEAVLQNIKKQNVDLILNLGDTLYGPIAPKETYELLSTESIISICGNQDRQIYEASESEIKLYPTLQYNLDVLGTEVLNWLKELPFEKRISSEIYLCHGTPKSDLEYLLENIESGYPILKKDDEIIKFLYKETSKIILCGHTHIFRNVMLSTKQLVINPGSVGLQAYKDDEPTVHKMENNIPYASYAIIEKQKDNWEITNKKIPYKFEKAVEEARKRGREDWAFYLSTGRCL